MEIKIVERVKTADLDFVKFVIEDISQEMANALRRIILTEVPTIAIKEVMFMENDSPLYDEMIAHRLGLIPLITDLENYNLPKECECGGSGCTLCQAMFELKIMECATKTLVTSKMLESSDPQIKPVSEDAVICKLGEGSSLHFEAYAQLGKGRDHAKFQPVAAIGFKPLPEVTINTDLCKDCTHEFIASRRCHRNLFQISDVPELIKDYWKDCSLCRACENYCPEGAIKVSWAKRKFVFSMEGTGVLELKEILTQAAKIFEEKVNEFELKFESLETLETIQ